MILGISIYLSNSCASLILSFLGVNVSPDTIKNIYDKIEIVDNVDVEEVGIDDVATRKGQKYATAIYDLKDHHLIALLEGRDAKTLEEWLKGHKKIKKIARDRASAYAKAIEKVLPDCIQVADRFHLLQNLLNHLKDIFYEEIPKEIFIKDGIILEKAPQKVLDLHVDERILNQMTYDNTPPMDKFGNVISFDNKIHDFDSKQYKKHAESRKAKQQLIISIQNRWNELETKDYKIINEEFNVCINTARKYINMTEQDIQKLDNPKDYKKRKTALDGYENIIYKMLCDDLDYKTIYAYLYYKGYQGSANALEHHIYLINKNNFPNHNAKTIKYVKKVYPTDVTVIKRNDLLKNILTINSKTSKDEVINHNMPIIKEKYPIIEDIEMIFKDFHSVIMGDKEEAVDEFIEKYYNSKINTFCESIKKDITPVKNAISFKISSGFVEGNNNKFKLIKRIVYGKCKLVNLFKKCYVAFLSTLDDFSLYDLI